MDDATAQAVVQERREPQRRRHACCTRLRNKWFSLRFLALARRDKKVLVSSDHLPPSTAKTTSFARARHPSSSGYRRSFRRRATPSATPSISAARPTGVPSLWRAHTNVVPAKHLETLPPASRHMRAHSPNSTRVCSTPQLVRTLLGDATFIKWEATGRSAR